jgi:predicted DNA-binding transcriptional regulator AlpA
MNDRQNPEEHQEFRRSAQRQRAFQAQLDVGHTKFYELMSGDPHFPKRFKIGKGRAYFIDDCNAYVIKCAEFSPSAN